MKKLSVFFHLCSVRDNRKWLYCIDKVLLYKTGTCLNCYKYIIGFVYHSWQCVEYFNIIQTTVTVQCPKIRKRACSITSRKHLGRPLSWRVLWFVSFLLLFNMRLYSMTISFNICHFRARVFLFANVEMVVQALYCNFCLQSANSFSVTRFYISMVKIESVSMWPLVLVFHGTWKKLGITPLRFTYSTFFCADDCLSFFMPI